MWHARSSTHTCVTPTRRHRRLLRSSQLTHTLTGKVCIRSCPQTSPGSVIHLPFFNTSRRQQVTYKYILKWFLSILMGSETGNSRQPHLSPVCASPSFSVPPLLSSSNYYVKGRRTLCSKSTIEEAIYPHPPRSSASDWRLRSEHSTSTGVGQM